MSETNEITSLNIDEVSHEVSELSEEAQALVGIYNNWMKREAAIRERLNEVQGELTIIQAAQQTLSAQIVNKVREEVAAKAAAEESASANVTEPPPAAETPEAPPEDPKAAAE